MLTQFEILTTSKKNVVIASRLMLKHKLKPADALILTTRKSHNIKLLATLDEDFKDVAEKEGIKLVIDIGDLEKI